MTSLPGTPQSSAGIYLDWNATTPPLPEVLAAMTAAASVAWGNPSSVHQAGRQARAVVEDSREAIARLCGSDPRDVLFTSGATEANNLALRAAPGLVTSRLEHPSVIRVAELLEREGRPVVWLPVPPSGRLEAADVESAIRGLPSGFVAAVMAVNHETGVIQALADIAELVRKGGGRLHVDAVQAIGKLPTEVWGFGDTLSVGAHKIRGPKGIGALVLRSPGVPQPVLVGGSQERGLRPGTVDPAAAAGFAVAARHAAQAGPVRHRELATLRDRIELSLGDRAVVNGAGTPRAPHVTNLSVHDWRGDELVAALDLAGVQIASGSACSAGTAEPSPVITSMVGRDRAERAIRVSLGEETNTEQIDDAISVMTRIVRAQSSSR